MPAWYANATPAPLLGMLDATFAAQPAGVLGAVNPRLLALFGDAVKDTDLSALAAVPAERATHLADEVDADLLW